MSAVIVEEGGAYEVIIPSMGQIDRDVIVSTLNLKRGTVSLRDKYLRDHYLGVFDLKQIIWKKRYK